MVVKKASKNSKPYVLALDCGTTGNRAIIFDRRQRIAATAYREFAQHYPRPGWVEHDADEIWKSVLAVMRTALKKVSVNKIRSIGITNQRETVVVWSRRTGRPAHRAIVWQCRRTADLCLKLKSRGLEKSIHRKTGLFLDPYFSATKIRWLMDHSSKIRNGLKNGELICGTIDTWVIWKLTGGQAFTTDPTNASRTLLYNIRKKQWDSSLCKLFQVPMRALCFLLQLQNAQVLWVLGRNPQNAPVVAKGDDKVPQLQAEVGDINSATDGMGPEVYERPGLEPAGRGLDEANLPFGKTAPQ